MELKELPIILVISINMLVGVAGVSSREHAGKYVGLLSLSIVGWGAALLWQRWFGISMLVLVAGHLCLASSPFWLGAALSSRVGKPWLFRTLATIIALTVLATVILYPKYLHAINGASLALGYLMIVVALWQLSRTGEGAEVGARDMLSAILMVFGIAAVFSLLAVFIPAMIRAYDQAAAILAAEAGLIVALRNNWLSQEKLLSRAMVWVTYSFVAGGLLLIPLTIVSREVGARPTVLMLSGFVAVAIISAAVFPWLGPRLTVTLENLMFPDASRIREDVDALRKDLEEVSAKLRRAERMRLVGEVAAQVAHEIKNPLGPIKGYVKLLLEDARSGRGDAESAEKGLGIILEEANRIDERVSRLLGFAKERSRNLEKVNMNDVCRRAVMLLEAGGELKPEGSISLELCSEQAELIADRASLEEALYNVLLNAAQATAGAGNITLKSVLLDAEDGRVISVEVSDNGPGFSCDDPEELFQPFFTTRPEGTGLGLGIVRNIIKSHGGTIKAIRSETGGASFTISLPEVKG